MCHSIIPFGAVHHWRHEAERRQAEILSRPLLGRVLGADGSQDAAIGLLLAADLWKWVPHPFI